MNDEAYLKWLAEQREKDEFDRKQGLSPLPRSDEERAAIFGTLPAQERRALRKRAEWKEELRKREQH